MTQTDAAEHPMALAALSRLASGPGWARVVAEEPLQEWLDVVDADLLAAAGILERLDADARFRLVDEDLRDLAERPQEIAQFGIAMLRRALRHAERGTVGWVFEPEIVLAQGRASGANGDLLKARVFPHMPSSNAALESGEGRFLDVGVGVAGISLRMCALYDGLRATGLDVLPEVLALAREEIARAGMQDRVEVREQSVAELDESEVYDLAWVPQPFIPRSILTEGVRRVFAALKPDRWLILPIQATSEGSDPFLAAVVDHSAHLLGGGPTSVAESTELLTAAGYVDVAPLLRGDAVLLIGRRP